MSGPRMLRGTSALRSRPAPAHRRRNPMTRRVAEVETAASRDAEDQPEPELVPREAGRPESRRACRVAPERIRRRSRRSRKRRQPTTDHAAIDPAAAEDAAGTAAANGRGRRREVRPAVVPAGVRDELQRHQRHRLRQELRGHVQADERVPEGHLQGRGGQGRVLRQHPSRAASRDRQGGEATGASAPEPTRRAKRVRSRSASAATSPPVVATGAV